MTSTRHEGAELVLFVRGQAVFRSISDQARSQRVRSPGSGLFGSGGGRARSQGCFRRRRVAFWAAGAGLVLGDLFRPGRHGFRDLQLGGPSGRAPAPVLLVGDGRSL